MEDYPERDGTRGWDLALEESLAKLGGRAAVLPIVQQLDTSEKRAAFANILARSLLKPDHHSVFWGDRMLTLDKSMGFLVDPAFAEAWGSIRGAHRYDAFDNQQSIAWRLNTLVWAARHALKLPAGDFIECGVFQGDMSFVTYHAASIAGSGRRMRLFDSFDGIDPARAVPGEYRHSTGYIENSNVHYQRPGLYESVLDRFALHPEVSVHKGFLPEGLAASMPEQIAWLHIDLNAAKPEVEVLEALFDRVVPSGTIILDDYGWLVLNAQKEAEDAFFASRGYTVLELPTGQGMVVKRPGAAQVRGARVGEAPDGPVTSPDIERLMRHADVFQGITPYAGHVPAGFTVDFLGQRTRHEFLPLTRFPREESRDRNAETSLPAIIEGELWFEPANWVEAARDASGSYVMITLGANYGAQAVGAALALRALNPMPFKLVAVEPVPENYAWVQAHMRDNGIDPDQQWLIAAAVTDSDTPILFPVGSPGSGSQNGFSTNEPASRRVYADRLIAESKTEDALRNILIHNTTGIITNLAEGHDLPAEIKFVSSVTLAHVLAPFERVDYIEADMQQSEILAFPPAMPLLKQKVRRIHIGTHGADVHAELLRLFVGEGWEIVFNFAPNSSFETPAGRFATNDGILTVLNPGLQRN